jgi:hypothetical protein
MKVLFKITAVIEVGAGLALLGCPAFVTVVLLGTSLQELAALVLARVCGAGLLALGVACWLARNDTQNPAAKGLTRAMTLYNLATVFILAFIAAGYGLVGVLLWPAVVLHAGMAVWCVAYVR